MIHGCLLSAVCALLAIPGAEGFGAASRGGAGGQTLAVTRLDDDPKQPQPGSLRWAVMQPGPRTVHFAVAGNIRLKAELRIVEPFLTIDGFDAPGDGVCICDHSLMFRTHDVIVRYVRIRRGDIDTLKMIKEQGRERPKGSGDLDCIGANDSSDLLFDHVSASWCNDEVFGIVQCKNVTIQWCVISEPLSNPAIHPYGDNHAFGLNLSASTLSLHHCLIAHYVMRGPQFEANDVRPKLGFEPKFEAVNNIMFDYERSGSRYTTGIEDHPEDAAGTNFAFQFVNNMYVHSQPRPEIEAELKHGVIGPLKVFVAGNLGPNRKTLVEDEWNVLFAGKTPMRKAAAAVQAQVSATRLFTTPIPVTVESAEQAYERVLKEAGCSHRRDSVDERIIRDVRERRTGRVIHSQADVGGWPELRAE